MGYTIYGNSVDDYIKKNYLEKIINSIVKDVKEIGNEPISIILFGGFGKGEGSVQFINNKPVPYNDFDFYIVTKEKISDEELDKISINASNSIGMKGLEIAYYPEKSYNAREFFHVDVRYILYDKLGKLINTQRYYELKYGSQVIYGEDVLGKMPEINPEDISVSEGLRNLFNKLHTMLLGLSEKYDDEQKKISIFWSYKCYLSICEALLILNGKFAPSYSERSIIFSKIYKKKFSDLYKKIPDLDNKVEKATNFKLKLDFNIEYEKLWEESLKDILIVFEYYLKKITWEDVETAIKKKLPYFYFKPYLKEKIGFNFFFLQYLLNLGYFNVLRKKDKIYFKPLFSWKDVGLRIILPIYFLLKYKTENDNKFLEKAYNELNGIIKTEKKEFWHLRERALRAFGLYYQQRLL